MKVLNLSMNKRFSRNHSKKGLMALQALIGTILSIIALFFIVNIFASVFLQNSTNEKIAIANAQSIVDFVNFAHIDNNENIDDCFYILKLHNLENYQIHDSDDNKNFFYVISNKAVNIISFKNKKNFLDKKEISGLVTKKIDFNYNINLISDITEDESMAKIDADFLFWNIATFGESTTSLNFDKNNLKYIFFTPYLSNTELFDFSIDITDKLLSWFNSNKNQNIFIPFTIDINGILNNKLENSMLVFDGKNLFVPKNSLSKLLILNNLCSYKNLKKIDEINFLLNKEHPERLENSFNKKIIYYWQNEDNTQSIYTFEWKSKKPFCFKDNRLINCNSILPISETNEKFKENIKKFYLNDKNNEKGEFKFEIKDLNFNEIETIPLDFNVFFKILDEDLYKIENKKEKNIYDLSPLWDLRDLPKYIIQIRGIEVYSYYKEEKNKNIYFTFNSFYLRKKKIDKENYDYYFNGKKVNFEKISVDKVGIGLFDNQEIYKFTIPFLNKDNNKEEFYNVYLTQAQLFQIKEFK